MAEENAVSPFVGRGREVDELIGTLAAVSSGRGRAIQITGEAGIGKTALAERLVLLARGSGFHVFWSSSLEDLGVPGYWIWREVAEDLHRSGLTRAGVEWPQMSAAGDTPVSHWDVSSAVLGGLREASSVKPLLLVFDDVQWIDSASLRLLGFVAKQLAETPVLLVATLRSGASERRGLSELLGSSTWQRIELQGLPEADVHELLQSIAANVNGEMAQWVSVRTGGNPLFVREVARLVNAETSRSAIPDSVRGVIQERLAGLEPDVRAALEVGSVFGLQFTIDALASIAGLPLINAAELCEAAERARMVRPAGPGPSAFAFVHDLTREVVYSALAAGRRSDLHIAIARYMEAAEHPKSRQRHAETARHLRASLDQEARSRAIEHERMAGEAAFETMAFSEAARFFRSASESAFVSGQPDIGAELMVRAGEAQRAAEEGDGGQGDFLAALPLVEERDARLLARCMLGLAPGRMDLGFAFRAPEPLVVQRLRRALAALTDESDPLSVRIMSRLAAELYFSGQRGESLELSERAVRAARRSGSERAIVDALATYHDIALVGSAEVHRGLDVANELLSAAAGIDDPEALLAARLARVLDLLALGRRTEVELEIAAFSRDANSTGRAGLEWFPSMWRAMLAIAAGRYQEAEELRMAALQLGLQKFGELAVWNASFQQFFLLREQNGLAALEATTRAFVAMSPEQPALACGLANLLAETGQLDAARVELERLGSDGFASIRDRNWPVSWFLLAEVAALTESTTHCLTLYDQGLAYRGLAIFSSIGATWVGTFEMELGVLAGVLGLRAAEDHFKSAIDAALRMGFHPWLLEAEANLGRWYVRNGRAEDGRALLRRVHRTASDSGFSRIARLSAQDDSVRTEQTDTASLTRVGGIWTIAFGGVISSVGHVKGMVDIAMLLRSPNVPFSATDLMKAQAPAATGTAIASAGVAIPSAGLDTIDREALRQYRTRLRDLDSELREAEEFADIGRFELLRVEREFLLAELSRSVGLGGAIRRSRSDLERARKAVEMRISSAIERIGVAHPDLGAHLRRCIRTGNACVYEPFAPVMWEIQV